MCFLQIVLMVWRYKKLVWNLLYLIKLKVARLLGSLVSTRKSAKNIVHSVVLFLGVLASIVVVVMTWQFSNLVFRMMI